MMFVSEFIYADIAVAAFSMITNKTRLQGHGSNRKKRVDVLIFLNLKQNVIVVFYWGHKKVLRPQLQKMQDLDIVCFI
uniref:Uncharacterized protein n=1 Tax=Nelumbo nucifera TaxID=4432 RepID=A0A822XL66_NELNU|nr:TPA_asm: hypothetical protein HUJ06_023818 [Nelumbo nucifera]